MFIEKPVSFVYNKRNIKRKKKQKKTTYQFSKYEKVKS